MSIKENLHSIALSAPVNVTWEITSRCNLSCTHCLSANTMEKTTYDLSTEDCFKLIDSLVNFGVFQVNIGGGEPFVRPDIWEILDYCHSKQLVTCISTNGTMINKENAKRLAAMNYTFIQVSLDGIDEETNDKIRSKGSYKAVKDAIANLIEAGFKGLSVNTVVTAKNFRQLPEIYKYDRSIGAKPRLSRFRPSGGGEKNWEEYRLSKEQTLELAELLSEYRDITTGDSFFSITASDRKDLGLNMCGAAKMTCCITPDGTVYPCAFLQDHEFYCGNVREKDFSIIWQEASILNYLRSLKSLCSECERFDVCHGGCPAIAWHLKKDISQPDPQCIMNI